jgi:hypothetical protein
MSKIAIKQYLWPSEVRHSENKPVLIQRKPDGTIFALDIVHVSNRVIFKMIAAGTDKKEVYTKVEMYYDRQLNSVLEAIMMLQETRLERSGAHVSNRTPEFIEDMREVHGAATTYDIARNILDEEMLLNEV